MEKTFLMQADFLLAKAREFGTALDRDDFKAVIKLLSSNCTYNIGVKMLTGPEAIAGSYQTNMAEGRNKLDELIWGKCTVELADDGRVAVFFTDYLKHNGQEHVHRCKQLLSFDENGCIAHIEHQNLPGEPERLKAFYTSVGLG